MLKLFVGAPSFGKTTLLCEYYNKLSKSKKCTIIYSEDEGDPEPSDKILDMYPTKIEIIDTITTNYLDSLNTEVILIDEAQNRSKAEIDLLVKYADENNVQILFFSTMFDIYGHIIPVIRHTLEIGIPFELIKRKCCKCGCTAFNTLHIDKNNRVLLSPTDQDEYEILMLCRKCYNKYKSII